MRLIVDFSSVNGALLATTLTKSASYNLTVPNILKQQKKKASQGHNSSNFSQFSSTQLTGFKFAD
ncbi:hypothetical protein GCM10009123_08410 [Kangiella japonica]|uniref:Uncharacterized protein n=1 Tax=Kangiella japonica TaxID=647384 RepID=A0ABN0SW91_9GAMM